MKADTTRRPLLPAWAISGDVVLIDQQVEEPKDIFGLDPSTVGRCAHLHKGRKPIPDQNLYSALLDVTDELFVVSTLFEMLQKGAVFGTAQLTLETCAAAASKCQEHVTLLAATQLARY